MAAFCLWHANLPPYHSSACNAVKLRSCDEDGDDGEEEDQLPTRLYYIPRPLGVVKWLSRVFLLLVSIPFSWHYTSLCMQIKWIFVCFWMKFFRKFKNQEIFGLFLLGQRPSSDSTFIDQGAVDYYSGYIPEDEHQRSE